MCEHDNSPIAQAKQESMSIWFTTPSTKHADELHTDTLVGHLDIEVTEVGEDSLVGTMPVDERTMTPYGVLHGGASLALAETLGSYASNCCVDPDRYYCVGLELNANHIRSATSGRVVGRLVLVHLGRRTHVWRIEIDDENGKRICESRMTVSVVKHKN